MSPGRCALNKEFRICNCINDPLLSQNNAGKKWEKPSKRFIKVNFDATVGENESGYGTIVRDDEGFVLGGGGGCIESRLSVGEAECVALEESIKVAWGGDMKRSQGLSRTVPTPISCIGVDAPHRWIYVTIAIGSVCPICTAISPLISTCYIRRSRTVICGGG
ncbi:hypothetical protein J1N35_000191 [Gossypium stocksii]|uniref:RNase H type-1 domain-containing protein n=1 Tax=Gossypium stocksii TaxID=47602 RepID=A0A9D3WHZ2_9ROSI|nr:hypothetical protein J1N35_000191 [Gossypium stocksii]